MAKFAISYDLHNRRHYQDLWNRLEGWGSKKLLESFWLVSLNASAAEVRESLKQVVDSDDSIAVIELKTGSDWATWNAKTEGVKWLEANL